MNKNRRQTLVHETDVLPSAIFFIIKIYIKIYFGTTITFPANAVHGE